MKTGGGNNRRRVIALLFVISMAFGVPSTTILPAALGDTQSPTPAGDTWSSGDTSSTGIFGDTWS